MVVSSVPSTWSNCTGAAVWVAGIVSPSSTESALGEPGRMSMKRLPSRKIRCRAFTSASSWIGSASSSSFMVTFTPGELSPSGSTLDTFPTSTPAIRTAVPFWIGGAFSNTAESSNGRVNGMSLVKPR